MHAPRPTWGRKPEPEFDTSLHRVTDAAARELARELGKQAAREAFDEMTRKQREAS